MEDFMGDDGPRQPREHFRTSGLAKASGYSVQQIRDLERLGVIPAAERADNNYRRFTDEHLVALRAYRRLAVAVGPMLARHTLREARASPPTHAAALISSLHVDLAKERNDALAAQQALMTIHAEAHGQLGETEGDSMTITELADALGVRSSTLRFWEQEGLVIPERVTSLSARRYPPAAIREARITAALRAAGYRIPSVRRTIEAIRRLDDLNDPLETLHDRLIAIARRTIALLKAGTDIANLIGID